MHDDDDDDAIYQVYVPTWFPKTGPHGRGFHGKLGTLGPTSCRLVSWRMADDGRVRNIKRSLIEIRELFSL